MRISIGIMVWNEQDSIEITLRSVFQQTLLTSRISGVEGVEVICVANGCTDESVPIARAVLEESLASCPLEYASGQVADLPGPDKPGAWNAFTHVLSAGNADYLVYIDGDVVLEHPDALWSMVRAMTADPHVHAASSTGIKDLSYHSRKGVFGRASLAMTEMVQNVRPNVLSGSLYAGEARLFRGLEMPQGMKGDDVFLTRVASTDRFRHADDRSRIAIPTEATFVFEAYTRIGDVFRQHRRRMIGRFIEGLIYDEISIHQQAGVADGGAILIKLNRENDRWLIEKLAASVQQRRWLLGTWAFKYQLREWWAQPRGTKKVVRLPLAVAATLWRTVGGRFGERQTAPAGSWRRVARLDERATVQGNARDMVQGGRYEHSRSGTRCLRSARCRPAPHRDAGSLTDILGRSLVPCGQVAFQQVAQPRIFGGEFAYQPLPGGCLHRRRNESRGEFPAEQKLAKAVVCEMA